MRTKHLILILIGVIIATLVFIVFGPAGEPNDSFKHIVVQTHQQLKEFQENLRVGLERKKLELDPKYLLLLGFTSPLSTKDDASQQPAESGKQKQVQTDVPVTSKRELQQQQLMAGRGQAAEQELLLLQQVEQKSQRKRITTPYNNTKSNFTIVSYVQEGQVSSVILLAQNIAAKLPNESLLIYDLGVSEEQLRSLNACCNSSRCTVITYDLSEFPSFVSDQRTHAYRPIVIKDALMRSKSILFLENCMRIRGSYRDLQQLQNRALVAGVLGWNTPTAVSSRTHPKMFDYFESDAENFIFLRMVDLDVVFFADTLFVTEKIMLPWLKCALTMECIDPIGAQSNGCKFNKKPLYRYSGCHGYDASAFNIVLGLTWHLDDTKYSLSSDGTKENLFYKETLEQAIKILESRRRNNSDTSDHPFTED
ncbi:uncharacterized protein LOC6578297 [Drosophila mojavensis]|uniref:Uncharacterized protein, isoform A n=1 Tax=Drosophila mojavensis TaxID=7230 RepID=B4KQ45_DROMO|nr:uncharacterized protein LOC6578297 [Drosophila mojavensis]XP_015018552.1 uncharacterized protein LOC6578297 [Drosophila mojavensis]EDW08147.1 uncharacterized protein Dmoj_GI19726, isoform A [Drosophila mojavensis]KRG03947.1 uncharacterized protein Dmoj_GI19726, isoform B [Drosophila mojavensis]KRG03948.1 uncharacterized protein Dmoj_GI19726, isoform C [Drosophila mojavensis]KRG03949.1 uncharacterized protein Dmoj_GI19726, isoform D [Drosophila mojavensis]